MFKETTLANSAWYKGVGSAMIKKSASIQGWSIGRRTRCRLCSWSSEVRGRAHVSGVWWERRVRLIKTRPRVCLERDSKTSNEDSQGQQVLQARPNSNPQDTPNAFSLSLRRKKSHPKKLYLNWVSDESWEATHEISTSWVNSLHFTEVVRNHRFYVVMLGFSLSFLI